MRPGNIRRLLVANRSEIAIRIFRAATELGIHTVAIYAEQDKLSLHRFKADEAYQAGAGCGPIDAYLSIDDVIQIAIDAKVDAIHPGYGFLSENPEFADACAAAGITFIGPSANTLRVLGNKIAAHKLAKSVGVPTVPASAPLPDEPSKVRRLAAEVGYPLMLKASWGGGGRGMRQINNERELLPAIAVARREAKAAFGKDEIYLEKLVRRARHIEVQLLGDMHGNIVHLFERDCTIQRRHQKLIEKAPATDIPLETRQFLLNSALKIGRATQYVGAGTVEFLLDAEEGAFYFIEVNPRIQVEHTVTEVVTGLDIVKAQIHIAQGGRLGHLDETGIPKQHAIVLHGHAIQCRITTESPENNFIPDYGRITAYRGALGFGIRVDGGTAYSGAVVTRHYDPLLEKVIAWAPTNQEAVARMSRALREYRIRGVTTNLAFLESILQHPKFLANECTTRFIDETPELVQFTKRQDRATRLLTYIADVTVNGQPDVRNPVKDQTAFRPPHPPKIAAPIQAGTKQLLEQLGPRKFSEWIRNQPQVFVTDTTMRDAHQSLLATRIRTFDLVAIADAYSRGLPNLLSLECWGGATFDVAMRFLFEDPWERLALLRERVPNILLQALVRGTNGVGYTRYPDNAVRFFLKQAAEAGVDLFRIFDCLNLVENMRASIDAVCEAGKLAEGAICYTGDINDPERAKYSLQYYVDLAKELQNVGCHILCVKDMAGLLKPAAARRLIKTLKEEVSLPIHLHTHDTSGISAATVLAAVEAGVNAIDLAMDALSGATSQPCLGSLMHALRDGGYETGLPHEAIRAINYYWEAVRSQYAAFESDMRACGSEVYLHEMPGGQYTNLKEQARALGLDSKWYEIANTYRAVNDMFGDIVKVTPSSKVVGDMALMMVAKGLDPKDVLAPDRDISFPASVVEMLRGELGHPPGGWPQMLQYKALKGEPLISVSEGSLLPPVELDVVRTDGASDCGRSLDDRELASYLMYPRVFVAYDKNTRQYGPVACLPTPVFFNGMAVGQEVSISIEPGKSLIVSLQAISETDDDGQVRVFFELNGQPRIVIVANRSAVSAHPARPKADEANSAHVGAPTPGTIAVIAVASGQSVKAGDTLMTVEAMKMEMALHSPRDGTIDKILVRPGDSVDTKDLVLVFAE